MTDASDVSNEADRVNDGTDLLSGEPFWKQDFMVQLRRLRDAELRSAMPLLEATGRQARILEIGGGDGWQAKRLAETFERVVSIDVEQAHNRSFTVYPVEPYDGSRIPLPDNSVDIVFSSNVLEHIPHVVEFQREIHRVLAPGGRAIHVLPSATWRFWGLVLHYPELPRKIMRLVGTRMASERRSNRAPTNAESDGKPEEFFRPVPLDRKPAMKRLVSFCVYLLWPSRHGERGTSLSELWSFSRCAWKRLFSSTGWIVDSSVPLHLFYTGQSILGTRWGIKSRTRWSRILGSSTHVTVLRAK